MNTVKGEGLVFQRKDGTYIYVRGFPGKGSYLASVLSRGPIAEEDVFLREFQLGRNQVDLIGVSEEELKNPGLFTEIGVPGTTKIVDGKEVAVPGIYPFHLY